MESSGYIILEKGSVARSTSLYTAYEQWCTDNLEKPLSQKTFVQFLRCLHRTLRLESQLTGSFLLQRRGGKGRRSGALLLCPFYAGNSEGFAGNIPDHSIYLLLVCNVANVSIGLDAFFLICSKSLVYEFLLDVVENNLCTCVCFFDIFRKKRRTFGCSFASNERAEY